MRIGVALGSGAARGLAHVGVLEALVEAGIVPAVVAGTSMGAVVGALFARWLDPVRVREHLLQVLRSRAFGRVLGAYWDGVRQARRPAGLRHQVGELRRALLRAAAVTRRSMVPPSKYARLIELLVGDDVPLEQMRIPCVAVAAGLRSCHERVIVSGSTRHALAASCAVPGVFPPVSDGADELVDGGVLVPVPVSAARAQGADLVVAVDVGTEELAEPCVPTGLDVVLRSASISRDALMRLELFRANLVITPEVGHLDWFDFHCAEEAMQRGADAARRAVAPWLAQLRRLAPRANGAGPLEAGRPPVAAANPVVTPARSGRAPGAARPA